MTGLPLLRLPLLPLKDVFDEICFSDLISFHLCSKKTRDLLKVLKKSVSFDSLSLDQKDELDAMEKIRLLSLEIVNNPLGSLAYFPKESITLNVVVSSRLAIEIEKNYIFPNGYNEFFPLSIEVKPINSMNTFVDTKRNITVDGKITPVVTAKHEMFTYWDDQSCGFSSLVNYFKKFFNSHIIECYIYDSTTSYFSQNLEIAAKGIAEHTLAKCIVTGYDFSNYDYRFILNRFNPTIKFEHVNYYTSVKDDFRCDTKCKSDYFVLGPANWFTLDNLSSMDCKFIKLLETNFTNNDIFECMIRWMDGKYPNLKRLTVQIQEKVNLSSLLAKCKFWCSLPDGTQYGPKRHTVVLDSDIIHIKLDNITVATISKKDSPPENVFEMKIF